MIDHYQSFLEAPSQAGFLELQQEVRQEVDYCAAGSFVEQLAAWCQAGRYETMFQKTSEMPFAWVASPSAHLYAAIAAEQMQNAEDAELERFLTESIMRGLLSTGNGSLHQPYRVAYLSDRQDLLAYLSAKADKQRLVRTEQGLVEVIKTTDGRKLCVLIDGLLSAAAANVKDRLDLRTGQTHPRLASMRLSATLAHRSW